MAERTQDHDTKGTETFRLRDGREILIRRIRPDDAPRLSEHFSRLSPRTRRFRFFGPMKELAPEFAQRLANVDFVERAAFVCSWPGEEMLRGVGRYAQDGPRSAEVAFVLDDDLHGLGLGTELLYHLAAFAQENGMTQLTAHVLADNAEMLEVFRNSGLRYQAISEGDVVRLKLEIGAEGQPA